LTNRKIYVFRYIILTNIPRTLTKSSSTRNLFYVALLQLFRRHRFPKLTPATRQPQHS
jgi:hypothetical protein